MSSPPFRVPLSIDKDYEGILTDILRKRQTRPRSDILDTKERALDIYQCFADLPAPPQVTYDDIVRSLHEVKSFDGQSISVHRFELAATGREQSTETHRAPAVLQIHGGGMFMGSVEQYVPTVSALVQQSGVQFFSVDYRLAPDYPHPAPTEDCYAALEWLLNSANKLGIDPHRVAIQGDSAGGGIAAVVAQMARDRKLTPKLAKQILIYPMLDDRTLSGDVDLGRSACWTSTITQSGGLHY
ncbi:Carboxylesterase NlhH [Cyphellophora attinorum]|uniref:Carboxylesterase NlhH n=1 Tax=Cyphellophora attinorum TaxID=1664694 RepID=A0A0N0NJD5_9EURO|nr:Carboxylesterase NlhH [Phialophora attinorum]KPI36788.1 Carboxylesterase NlhH [Phialophora attinorum]